MSENENRGGNVMNPMRYLKSITLGTLIIFIIPLVVLAQPPDPGRVNRQILLMVKPGVITLAPGEIGGHPDQLTMDSALQKVLIHAQVEQIIRGMPSFTQSDTLRILSDGRIYRSPDYTNFYLIEVPNEAGRDSVIAKLNQLPSIRYAESNHLIRQLDNEKPVYDEHFGKQWNMKNTGQGGGEEGADVKATFAWYRTTGSGSETIAIIDHGIMWGHQDFTGRVSGDPGVDDEHGTKVAGVAAAAGNNGEGEVKIGIAGMDWCTKIVSEISHDIYQAKLAVRSAVDRGARVINMSWNFPSFNQSLYDEFISAYAADVMLVVAGPKATAPEPWPNNFGSFVHNVSATNFLDQTPDYVVGTPFMDVVAPGGWGTDTDPSRIYTTNSNGGWTWAHGTSYAAPHSVGLASLIRALDPDLHNYDLEWIQKLTTDGYGAHDWDEWGYGRINADAALALLQDPYELTQGEADLHLVEENASMTWYNPIWPGFMGEEDEWGDGMYIVDKHVLEAVEPFNPAYESPPEAWLSQTGYSGADGNNPPSYNYQYMYRAITKNSMTLKTFFYFFKNRVGEQGEINIWVPHNPYDLAVGHTRVGIPAGPQPPSAPTLLGGAYWPPGHGGPKVELEWNRNPPNEDVDKYWLERAIEEGEFHVIKKGVPDPGSGSKVYYTDYNMIPPGTEYVRYKVRAHNDQGWGPFCDPAEVELGGGPERAGRVESAPTDLTLDPNYPNPFNPTTQIKFGLPAATHVRLQIMNVRGQTIRVLVDEQRAAGWYTVTWDSKNESGRDVASGIYLYLIEADNKKILKKMTLIR